MTTSAGTQQSWTDRITAVMERMAPIFDQPHLASVRDGLAALTPLLIIGAFSLLIANFPIVKPDGTLGYLGDLDQFADFTSKVGVFFSMTYGFLGVFAAIAIAYNLARRRGLDPLMPTLLSLVIFLLFASPFPFASTQKDPFGNDGAMALLNYFYDNHGIFLAILLSLLSVEAYRFFVERNLVIRMPPQVPPSIANAFIALIPGIVLMIIAWVIRVLLSIDVAYWVNEGVSKIIPAASSFPAAAFAESLHATLWTLGIHGDLTIGIVMQPIWTNNDTANAAAAQAHQTLPFIYNDLFRSAYVVAGGSGATLPLAFYLIRSKSARLRRVGWLGIWPGIFNINEPITFGTPVIFNPVLAIPFILITFLNVVVGWLAHSTGFIPNANWSYISMPWTLPGPLLAFFQAGYSWQAAVLAIVNEFLLPGLIWYLPFKAWEAIVLEKEGAAEPAAAKAPAAAR